MTHPLVTQLRFTRSEFMRAVKGVGDDDARKSIPPYELHRWNIGQLAWHAQSTSFLWTVVRRFYGNRQKFCNGAPASTPPLERCCPRGVRSQRR